MKIEEIMTAPAVTASPNDTVLGTAYRLAGSDIGAMPVCETGRLVGLVTDRDIVIRCLAKGMDPAVTTVGEIMTEEPVAVNVGMDAAQAACLMGRKQIRRLPVLRDGMLRGMVSLTDIAAVESEEVGDALRRISKNTENF